MSDFEEWISRAHRRGDKGPLPLMTFATAPYHDQQLGASGLRKKTCHFEAKPCYLENFVQSIFFSVDLKDRQGASLVVGGDGRYFNKSAIETIVQMAAANGVGTRWLVLSLLPRVLLRMQCTDIPNPPGDLLHLQTCHSALGSVHACCALSLARKVHVAL